MRSIIFANGEFQTPIQPVEIQKEDLVIAADGGSRHCLSLDIKPAVLIGDLDSIDQELLKDWQKTGVEIIQHPEDKNETDLELALLLAQERGAKEILVYGAVGGRLDMTLGNLIMLAHPRLIPQITLICGNEEVHLLHAKESLSLSGKPGEIVSLIPMKPGTSIVSTNGLLYPLNNDALKFGYTRGISNQLVKKQATINLDFGLLVIIHTRKSPQEDL